MKTKEEDMARKVLGVMKDPKLKCELEFVVTFGRLFFNKHFRWLQRIDEHTKESGFQSHEMLARVCIMDKELLFLKDNWRTMDDFAPCVHILDNLPPDETSEVGGLKRAGKETTSDQFRDFFDEYTRVFTNNFRRWKQKLVPFSIASSNKIVSKTIAEWYCNEGIITAREDIANIFASCHVHLHCSVSLHEFISFLKTCDFAIDPVLQRHQAAVLELANGTVTLYERPVLQIIFDLLRDVKSYYFIVASTTQMVEAAVQESSLCSLSGKGEDDTCTLIVIRSVDMMPVIRMFRDALKSKIKAGNQHMSRGKDGERELKSESAKRNEHERLIAGREFRQQVHATKDKARAHIRYAIEKCPNVDEVKAVRAIQKKRKLGDGTVPLQSKVRRQTDWLEIRKATLQSTRKKSENIPVNPVHVPDAYEGLFPITSFHKAYLIEHCHREMIARGVTADQCSSDYSKISKAKLKLGKLLRAEREDPPPNLEEMEWSAVKNSLEGSKGKAWFRLIDLSNSRPAERKLMFEMAKRGWVPLPEAGSP